MHQIQTSRRDFNGSWGVVVFDGQTLVGRAKFIRDGWQAFVWQVGIGGFRQIDGVYATRRSAADVLWSYRRRAVIVPDDDRDHQLDVQPAF